MANDLQKFFGGHQVPSRENLTKSLANLSAAKNALMGKALLRMGKDGSWVFGQDNTRLEAGTVLIANPASMASGYVAWYMAKIEGEVMQPLSMGPVDPEKLGPVNSGTIPPGKKVPSGKGWEDQVSVDLITRGEVPLSLTYKVSSLGGKKALLTLAGDIAFGLSENPKRVYPLVALGVDSYQHTEFGEVFTPILTVVGWLDENGDEVKEFTKIGQGSKGLL